MGLRHHRAASCGGIGPFPPQSLCLGTPVPLGRLPPCQPVLPREEAAPEKSGAAQIRWHRGWVTRELPVSSLGTSLSSLRIHGAYGLVFPWTIGHS